MRLFSMLVAAMLFFPTVGAGASAYEPVPGMVTFMELGSPGCLPCKLMEPIRKKLDLAYAGRVAIVYIDIWEHPEAQARYNVNAVPTHIFFDKEGKEVRRHTGFLPEPPIRKILDSLLQ